MRKKILMLILLLCLGWLAGEIILCQLPPEVEEIEQMYIPVSIQRM